MTWKQAALAEKASLTASVSGSQLGGDDAGSDLGDGDAPSKRSLTPQGTRRERDLPPAGQKDKKEELIRNLENQVHSL